MLSNMNIECNSEQFGAALSVFGPSNKSISCFVDCRFDFADFSTKICTDFVDFNGS